ncbi:hypothetical protein [Halolamina salina]
MTERGYEERVDDPESVTVRHAGGEPAVRSTLVSPTMEWDSERWLVGSRDELEALYFSADATGVDAAEAFLAGTDLSAESVLVHQYRVDECVDWELQRLQWREAEQGPAGSVAVELRYESTERGSDCERGDDEDVAATFVRIPATFERVTRFGSWVS